MKISIPLVIEVDPEKWAEARGDSDRIDAATLRRDVRSYLLATVQNSAMVDEAEAEISFKRGTEW